MDHRNGSPPHPLPTDQPIPQPIVDLLFTDSFVFNGLDYAIKPFRPHQAIEFIAVDHLASVLDQQCFFQFAAFRNWLIMIFWNHYHWSRNVIASCKKKIPLIMSRDSHDRSGAIACKYIFGDPDGNTITIQRIDGVGSCENSVFFLRFGHSFDFVLSHGVFTVNRHFLFLIIRYNLFDQFMLWSKHTKSHPEDGIWPCGKNTEL